MAIVSIILVLTFGAILCFFEVPQMLQSKSRKELQVFSVLLTLGAALAILKSLKVSIPSPSDWLAWMYSPVSDLLKIYLQ